MLLLNPLHPCTGNISSKRNYCAKPEVLNFRIESIQLKKHKILLVTYH